MFEKLWGSDDFKNLEFRGNQNVIERVSTSVTRAMNIIDCNPHPKRLQVIMQEILDNPALKEVMLYPDDLYSNLNNLHQMGIVLNLLIKYPKNVFSG
jgi:hypothetical protein